MKSMYFWSPSVNFKIINGELRIERFNYGKKGAEFFPELYYYTQDGTELSELKERFSENKRAFLNNLIKDLIKKKILVNSILSPKEIFYSQKKIFNDDHDEDMRFVKEKLEEFKLMQTERHVVTGDTSYILANTELPPLVEKRCSVREFSSDPVSYSDLSYILGCLKNKPADHTRYYPSAGGLATLDIYVHIKEGRVEGIDAGLYYYDPVLNSLVLADDGKMISSEAHYITNRDIYEGSAFTVYFVYNGQASMPKYGGMAYFYGIMECGIIISLLTAAGEKKGIGNCCIGDMYYEKILPCFKLKDDQVLLHSMEFGKKR